MRMNKRYDEAAHMGQKIRTESSPDKSSHQLAGMDSLMGRKCGGGVDDVSHSLSGAGSVQTYNDKSGVAKKGGSSGYGGTSHPPASAAGYGGKEAGGNPDDPGYSYGDSKKAKHMG